MSCFEIELVLVCAAIFKQWMELMDKNILCVVMWNGDGCIAANNACDS